MSEKDKENGTNQPDNKSRLESMCEVSDLSVSGRHAISRTDGQITENPLGIYDQTKSDQVTAFIRVSSIWLAHCLVTGIFAASMFAQLVFVPPRVFTPPIELIAIILGIYGGTSSNLITKAIEVFQSWKKK